MTALDDLWGPLSEQIWFNRIQDAPGTVRLVMESSANHKRGTVTVHFDWYSATKRIAYARVEASPGHVHFTRLRLADPTAAGIYLFWIKKTGLQYFRDRGVTEFTADAGPKAQTTLIAGGFERHPAHPGSLRVDLTQRNRMDDIAEAP